jgi:hypothetical protein
MSRVCWHDRRMPWSHECGYTRPLLFHYGRCRSGRRWFWAAECWRYDDDSMACEHGWEDTEEAALTAARNAVEHLAAGREAIASEKAYTASCRLKEVNAEKRKARPAPDTSDARAIEYLYAVDHYVPEASYERERWTVVAFRITKKTPKRIYYVRSHRYAALGGDPEIGYISRQELESDTRCGAADCASRGYCVHGTPPGEISTGRRWYHADSWLYATREQAQAVVDAHTRAAGSKDLKQLRREMADAHPDRGGNREQFTAARAAYLLAKERAS